MTTNQEEQNKITKLNESTIKEGSLIRFEYSEPFLSVYISPAIGDNFINGVWFDFLHREDYNIVGVSCFLNFGQPSAKLHAFKRVDADKTTTGATQ